LTIERKTKVCLGWPWYNGPDVDTYQRYMEVCHYFGKMQERSEWLAWMRQNDIDRDNIPLLDRMQADGDRTEITVDDGVFEFVYADESGLSLPGLARERIVENAQSAGADWLFMWDDDMLFPWSAFLRLWRHQKPVVAALAFTARDPICPVIYRITRTNTGGEKLVYGSDPVLDYPKNALISDDDIDGPLAFGAGVVLINMNVFRTIEKPWFNSTGCGEDYMFCLRCYLNGIPRYVDTSLKTLHRKKEPQWASEIEYEKMRKDHPGEYLRFGGTE